ncbi:unnamed protein product [Adineta steineri]|uniref:Uncharacterized protein n=1 Tax=Adineta steineri TaxID=433720 RepID=A0A814ALK3_9BILA|nr:unnamed protein product [Adineta steineri]CAF4152892.1 unnamed protein product [Adineta steineri]
MKKLYKKGQEECAQFNKEGNTLWGKAFEKMILIYKEEKTCSFDIIIIIDIIKKIMSRREDIDLNENGNGNDNRHDLPVYHRIQRILTILASHIKTFAEKKKVEFHSITPVILQFDKTLAYDLTIILIGILKKKCRRLFVFKFLLNLVFYEYNVDREECKHLLRQMRQSNNLCTRRQAMNYIMPWAEDGTLIKKHGFPR